ncbi:MAG: hypothetical protein IJF62_03120 [Firmicutes bacterium]|nr:hypothetical protein [Bacillota bacterium]MBQ3111361.1 hypothetical protein [Bacillota bacterium]MBQ6842480.1 hypothetical protein [Bacillota bacterium]MBR6824516.1 hypothetical protein [Bacillota bacterium]MBR7114041.1 hypothetical protein [Bacillota bacterium]
MLYRNKFFVTVWVLIGVAAFVRLIMFAMIAFGALDLPSNGVWKDFGIPLIFFLCACYNFYTISQSFQQKEQEDRMNK